MPILKKLPGRSKSCHEIPRVNGELILPRLDLDLRDLNDLNELKELNDLKDLNKNLNPFEDVDLDEDERNGGDMGLIMGEVRGNLQLRSSCDGEEEENEVNAERHGAGNPKGKPLRGTLERICGVTPFKTLGKLGKGLRISGRNVWGNNSPHYSPGESNTLPPEMEKRKGLRRKCELLSLLPTPTTPTLAPTLRRKAKDVELLYEALQKEMWDVVRESLRQPSAGPNLGLVVLVIQQEEHADARPRRLKMKWRQAVAEAGQLASYLERLRSRMVDDLDAARRNAVSIYPEEFAAFQVYVESYHRAVAKRLQTITSGPLQITDVYSLLDWFFNIYNRDVLGTIGTTTPINYAPLEPILLQDTVDRLEQDCINIVKNVTTELIQVLDEEERRWAQTLHIEEYQSHLARAVDLDRSTAVNHFLGARVARCSLTGLADFLYNFQRKVEMFHETQAEFGDRGDGYVSKTIALVNCCPPLRAFVERCRQCDPQGSEESAQKANLSLDKIINQSVRVLTNRLFEHIRVRKALTSLFSLFTNFHYLKTFLRVFLVHNSEKHPINSSWLDSVICHLADIILLEDTPSIQMEVAVLVKEFPDIRKKHVSSLLNIRGMMRQAERQEILNIVKDFECSSALMCRDRALFSDIPITSEVHCISLGLLRLAMTPSLCYAPEGNFPSAAPSECATATELFSV
uniref:Exocyst complex component 3-like 2a n=1 Tax=Monopterus albus TaxID=43700 RepID=A0A3Q3IPK7_MONAL